MIRERATSCHVAPSCEVEAGDTGAERAVAEDVVKIEEDLNDDESVVLSMQDIM